MVVHVDDRDRGGNGDLLLVFRCIRVARQLGIQIALIHRRRGLETDAFLGLGDHIQLAMRSDMRAGGHFGLDVVVVLRPGEGGGQAQLAGCAAARVGAGRGGDKIRALVMASCKSGLPPVPAAADTSVSASARVDFTDT